MKLIILLLFTLSLGTLFGQSKERCKKEMELQVVECENKAFIVLIDSLLDYESKCRYYTDSLYFTIRFIENAEDSTLLSMGIQPQKHIQIIMDEEPLSVFLYGSHYFFIYNYVPKVFFAETQGRYIFHNRNNRRNKVHTVLINDDSTSYWIYYYNFEKDQFMESSLCVKCKQLIRKDN